MPHITIKPFNTSMLKKELYRETKVLFKAIDLSSSDELIAVEVKSSRFLLHLKKAKESWLLKYDKVTRPLDVNLIKKAIDDILNGLNLDILNSNITIHHNRAKIANRYEKSIEDFIDIEFPFKDVSIEVGFGSGKHILYQAISNPNELFIGIEIHTPSAKKLLRQIELKGLNNIWVVNYDARLLLEMIPSNSLHKIFVHFPVPWDKKPQRRVISSSFLDESMRALKKGGRLELRTDSSNYFWYSLNTFLDKKSTAIDIRKNISLAVTSKYEARWLREEKDIYDVSVTSLNKSKDRDIKFDFDFNGVKYSDFILEKISKKPILFNDFFIHFERFYRIDINTILIKVAFGSFNRPEQKYIYIGSRDSYYFGLNPIKSNTNYKAHLKIKEYLNV